MISAAPTSACACDCDCNATDACLGTPDFSKVRFSYCAQKTKTKPGEGESESDWTLFDLGEVAGVCAFDDGVDETDGGCGESGGTNIDNDRGGVNIEAE